MAIDLQQVTPQSNAILSDISARLPFTQSAKGAVARLMRDELDDMPVNVKRFGVVGDGVTADTVAFQLALDTGRTLFIPANTTVLVTGTIFMVNCTSIAGESNRTSKIL